MFSIDNAFFSNSMYLLQKDLYLRAINVALGVFFLVEFIRAQIPEIEVLQLVPGVYLFVLFIGWLFLITLSNCIQRFPHNVDNRKLSGTKTLNRIELGIIGKGCLATTLGQLIINLYTVIPIGFDAFNNYGEQTLENLWSFDEIVGVETSLFIFIFLIAQTPILTLINYTGENYLLRIPNVWRSIGVISFLLGGIITPTIDIFTQLSFATSTYSLYLLVISVTTRRMFMKYREAVTLS